MKTNVKNRIDMYKAVLSVLNENHAIWENTTIVGVNVNKLSQGLSLLEAKAAMHNSITLGVAQERKAKYEALLETMVIMQDALWIYGNVSNNHSLMARNKLTPKQTANLNISLRLVRVDTLAADVESYGTLLVDYGVTPEMIIALNEKIAAYRAIATNPRLAIIDRKSIGVEIDQKTAELGALLRNELDRSVRMFYKTHPNFVVSYFSARDIVNLNGKKGNKNAKQEPDDGN